MKKGTLNFLTRKNQSLFDTNVKMKDMDNNNVELVLTSGTILESGTASVRARPTVKHYSSSGDSFQGFAVPTPTVPLYTPAVNGTKFNGSVSDGQSSNGSTISVSDPIEEDIFVPPPPSMAPPPPPEVFLLPPPEFMGDLNTLQPPPKTAPKPQSQFLFRQEDDFAFLMPPPMSPPKPPSTGSNGSSSVPISSPVPEHPKYAPPQPPAENPKTFKSPPPKPIRISSVPSMDLPPDGPAPPPPVHTPTLSTFNPQSPAKLYSAPKTSFRNIYEEQAPTVKPKLLLQDSGAGPLVETDGKVPTKPSVKPLDAKKVPDVKPNVPKPVKEVQEIETVPKISIPPPPSTPPEQIRERTPLTAAALKEFSKNPKIHSVKSDFKTERIDKPDSSSIHNSKYSPLIDAKLRHINGPSAPKDTSPLSLLMAAKQRDRQKSSSHDNSLLSRNLSTNSGSSWSLNSQELQPESPKREPVYASVNKSSKKPAVSSPGGQFPSATVKELSPNLTLSDGRPIQSIPEATPKLTTPSLTVPEAKPSTTLPETRPSVAIQKASPVQPNLQVENTTPDLPDLDVPFLPPPPEFDDFEDIDPPPTMRPPDPPKMAAPTLTHVLPTPPPKTPSLKPPIPIIPTPPKPVQAPAPPPPPQLPPLSGTTAKAKPPPVMAKPKPAQDPLPTATTPSQATLLNILKKKMMEMDHKISSDAHEQESNSDDWGSPEDYAVPVMPKVNLPKNNVVQNASPRLDMNELQSKVTQKSQEPLPNRVPIPTSNGPSRHQYGMTFTVRPGTNQPITLVHKGE